ncbi:MAG: putative quinol monooxygenase [Rhodoglobus sp.]
MSSRVGVIVSIRVKPGRGADQVALFEEIAPLVRSEDGCISYDLYPVAGEPNQFVILEWWESVEAIAAHDETPHMVAADAKTPAFRDGPAHVTLIESSL